MEIIILVIATGLVIGFFAYINKKRKTPSVKINSFNEEWRAFLNNHVQFYRELNTNEKNEFETRVLHFLNTTKITGIQTQVDITDKLLVASSAVIPIFYFSGWEYINLYEVLLYPKAFNSKYEMNREDSSIVGMVGTGAMEGKMILSKPALIQGFKNENDKLNVGIHEFIHLVDKTDGVVDGIPSGLLEKQYTIPWINMIKQKMKEIHSLNSDINKYGGVNEAEFFSVISEYFFERPKLLREKHPAMYTLLSEIFTVDLAKKYKNAFRKKREIMRNDPCICGSGKKFKHCCGKTVAGK